MKVMYLRIMWDALTVASWPIFDSRENPKKSTKDDELRQQYGVVQYETNVLGSKGPRRMKVLMPMVNRDGQELFWPDTEVHSETI